MKKWLNENWDFIIVLVVLALICMFLVYPIIKTITPPTQQKENGWYEATIFCDGVEIIRGQLLDLDESRNCVKVNICNETYIVSKDNIIIHFIPYD